MVSQSSLPDPIPNALDREIPVREISPEIESWTGGDPGHDLKHGFPTRLIPLRIHAGKRFYITITPIIEETKLEPDHWLHIVPESQTLYDSASTVEEEIGIPETELNDDEMMLCQRVTQYRHKDPDAHQESKTIKQPFDNAGSIRLYLPEELIEEWVGLTIESYPDSNPLLFEPVYEEGAEVFGLDPLGHAREVCRDAETESLPFSTAYAELVERAIDVKHDTIIYWTDRLADSLSPATFAAAGIDQAAPPRYVETDGVRYGIFFYPVGALKEVAVRFHGIDPELARGVWLIHSNVAMGMVSRLYSSTGDTDAVPADDPIKEEGLEPVVMPLPE